MHLEVHLLLRLRCLDSSLDPESAPQLRMESAMHNARPGSTRQVRECRPHNATMPHSECQNRCHIQNVRWNVQIFFLHTYIYIFCTIIKIRSQGGTMHGSKVLTFCARKVKKSEKVYIYICLYTYNMPYILPDDMSETLPE